MKRAKSYLKVSMISEEEVKHIARLARLELTEKETKKMQKDLSEILGYFDLLKKAPKVQIPRPEGYPKSQFQNLRKDEVVSNHDLIDELIAAVPDKKDNYIKVKTIL
jgi:aspartyl/glutamyl-tRNA(Asn/Gln) amidotransferase C subunit